MTAKTESKTINFMRLRFVATVLSLVLVAGSLVSLATKGLSWGLEFTGGTLIELVYDNPVSTEIIREQLVATGYPDAVVQEFGSAQDILVRIPGENSGLSRGLADQLNEQYAGEVELKRVEFVGPQVGEQLREQGGLGMLMALAMVMIYIAFRFQFKFSIGAVVALTHDTIIALGALSLFGIPFDLTVLAAVLALVGYSLNDTIIIYDRVRENFRKHRKSKPEEIINISLNQTMGRTLATSCTTLMVLVALLLFGGEMNTGFATTLIVGIGIGTYSSIYIASNLLLYMGICREDLLVAVENTAVDDRP